MEVIIMGFEQDVIDAYRKWKAEQAKIPLNAENRELKNKLFKGMGKLRGELIDFAKVFDEEIVNKEEVTIDKAKEMKDFMCEEFINKISEFKKFIDFEDIFKDASKKCSDYECKELKIEATKTLRYIELRKKAFKNYTWGQLRHLFPSLKGGFSGPLFRKPPEETEEGFHGKDILLQQVYDYFSFLFESMGEISLKLLKKIKIEEHNIEAKDEKLFVSDDGTHTDKYRIGYAPEDTKIFPTDESPSPHEVQQAGIGDCYLLATLMALSKNNKKAITDCFVQGIKDIDKHDKIIIRFYKFDIKKDAYQPVKITVDKRKIVEPEATKNRALWPKLIEKAFIVYESTIKSRDKIDGGYADYIFELITGFEAKETRFSPYADECERVIPMIKSELKKGRSLTCNFKQNFYTKDIKCGERIEIKKCHVYAIMGIMEKEDPKNKTGKDYVRLIEPNKRWGRSIKHSPKSKEGGHIAMAFNDFVYNFNLITRGKA